MNNVINEINQRLENILSQYPDSKVKEAMYYSLKAVGKRIRPLIVLQVIRSVGDPHVHAGFILVSDINILCRDKLKCYG